MFRVRVIGPGVKLANQWCFKGDDAIIDAAELERNKDYVEVIEELNINSNTDGKSESDDENNGKEQKPENEKPEGEGGTPEDEKSEGENDNPEGNDEELEALKERAKNLGINVTHNMKKETIIKKIQELTAEAGEGQNPEGE